jgi:hypothetical protein
MKMLFYERNSSTDGGKISVKFQDPLLNMLKQKRKQKCTATQTQRKTTMIDYALVTHPSEFLYFVWTPGVPDHAGTTAPPGPEIRAAADTESIA